MLVVDHRSEDVVTAVRAFAPDGRPRAPRPRHGANHDLDVALGTRHQFVLDAAVAAVSAAVADGALPVGEEAGLSLHRYRLADTGAAQAAVEAGAVGKVLVDVS